MSQLIRTRFRVVHSGWRPRDLYHGSGEESADAFVDDNAGEDFNYNYNGGSGVSSLGGQFMVRCRVAREGSPFNLYKDHGVCSLL